MVDTRETHNEESYQSSPGSSTSHCPRDNFGGTFDNQGTPCKIVYFTDVNNAVICNSSNDCFCARNDICF